MSHRYKIRAFESGEQDGALEAGTIVLPIDRSFTLFARSADEAERQVQAEIIEDRLLKGRVYQVIPPFGRAESVRSFAVWTDGRFERAYLDPAQGVYSEFRRIRYQDLRVNKQRDEVPELQQA